MEKSRIAALVDGIFAVAMTLLVLDLKLPQGGCQFPAFYLFHGRPKRETQFRIRIHQAFEIRDRLASVILLQVLERYIESAGELCQDFF